MKQILEFIPLIIFFILFKMYDIYVGVSALMISSTISFFINWLIDKKIEKMALFTYLMIMIFGTMTLYFHNANFIKWKVTIIYLLFAIVLLTSQIVFKKPLLQNMLAKGFELNNSVWNKLNMIWAIFFLVCAIANLYITYFMSEEFWATFKVFILPSLTLVISVISGIYMYKNINKAE
ncbi:MAG: septation protein A [Candidatus Schmidhempelia sp.]|nr:septation protein A [Candidatus Schmidhempelia sp.]